MPSIHSADFHVVNGSAYIKIFKILKYFMYESDLSSGVFLYEKIGMTVRNQLDKDFAQYQVVGDRD